MPASIRNVVKSVLEYLRANDMSPTPENYNKVFYQQANIHGLDISNYDRLNDFVNKLNKEELVHVNNNEITDVDSLFDYLVEKLRDKEKTLLNSSRPILSKVTIDKIVSLMISSLAPAYVNEKLDDDIVNLSKKIQNDVTTLNDSNVQDNIEEFISNRKESDTNNIVDKTHKLNSIVNTMDNYIEHTVQKSGDSLRGLDLVLKGLEQVKLKDINTKKLEQFKNRMIDINNDMKDLVTDLSLNLQSERNEVVNLRQKVLELEENLRDAKVESSVDFLTGAFTRREFNRKIKELNDNYNSIKEDFSIVYIDLDYFKEVNDKYGHDAGDIVLKTFSRVLQKKAYKNSEVYRYGGEEFVVLLPKKNKEEANKYIQSVKTKIDKSKFVLDKQTIKVTFSAGIALRSEHRRVDDFIKEADRLLYKAKDEGRDLIHYI